MASDMGRCVASREMLDSLSHEQPDLAFTSGGLADAIAPPAMAQQVAAIEWACDRRASAQARWNRLARALAGTSAPMSVAIADAARARLGRARTAAERVRLERALEAATSTLESGATTNPGLMEYARASLLAALGRGDESRASFGRVFVFPDRNLSHALARAASRRAVPKAVQ
jgi:hypothetical protein